MMWINLDLLKKSLFVGLVVMGCGVSQTVFARHFPHNNVGYSQFGYQSYYGSGYGFGAGFGNASFYGNSRFYGQGQFLAPISISTVVARPVVGFRRAVVLVPPDSASDSAVAQDYEVNIPNGKGRYLSIVVKRSGEGYLGPQGEYYASFPSVDQLRAMYVK